MAAWETDWWERQS